jgi:UDP-N-acetylmuramyl pentapeptide phosphotransferase/UDP-N-acetylglucosamine-1-phosphate transferase
MQMMPQVPQRKDSAMPVAGGVLILIGSLVYFLIGGLMAASGAALLGWTLGGSGVIVGCGIVVLLLGVIALLGGIFAIQKKHFGIAIIGGVLVIPSILGLIGLILVAVSKDSFES